MALSLSARASEFEDMTLLGTALAAETQYVTPYVCDSEADVRLVHVRTNWLLRM